MKSIQYIAKPFEDSSDEDGDEDVVAIQQIKSSHSLLSHSNSNRKRGAYEASTVVSIYDDIRSQPRSKSYGSSSSSSNTIDIDDDIVEVVTETRQDVAKALAQKSLASITIDLIDDEETSPSKKQKKSKPTKAQQKQISDMLMQLNAVRGCLDLPINTVNPLNIDSVVLLEDEAAVFVVPKTVKSASERAPLTIMPTHLELSEIDKILGRTPSVSSSSNASDRVETSGPSVLIRTRLNDSTSHEKKWKISQSKNFKELRVKVADVYKVNVSLVKFKFEGGELKDTQSPLTEDMEDDTLIDVIIPKDKHIAAVAAATTIADAPSSAPALDNEPCVKIRTRLNDSTSHEKKWKISQSKNFKELRVKVADLYKVNVSLVKFKFEGGELKDTQSPLTEDMEDDTLIDVIIPKDKHIAAVAAATTIADAPSSASAPPRVKLTQPPQEIIDIKIKVLPECLAKKRKTPMVFTSRFDVEKHLNQFDSTSVVKDKLKRLANFTYTYDDRILDAKKSIRELGLSHGSEIVMKLQ